MTHMNEPSPSGSSKSEAGQSEAVAGGDERLRAFKFLKKYVHVTTPEVYGSTSAFIDETAPFNPSTPYAVSRAAGRRS